MTRRARIIVAVVVAAGVSWLVPWALAPAPFHYAPPMATLETASFTVAAAAPARAEQAAPATTDDGAEAAFAEADAEHSSADADATDADASALPAIPELPAGAGGEKATPDWAARLATLAPLGGAGAAPGAPDFSLPETGGGAGGVGGAPAVGQSEGPQLLAPPAPAAYYPYAARANGTTGNTLVRLSVGGDGAVTAVEVVESAPPGVFEAAARRLGRALRFRPAMANGRPVPARVELRLNWRLD